MKTFATILILLLILAICIVQFAFFVWFFRKIKENKKPVSPEAYRFACIAIASVLLVVAFSFAAYTTFLLATGTKTTGVVTDFRISHDKDGNELFAPTFTFVDQSGATNTVDSTLYSSPRSYHLNDLVPVIYRPADPSKARINHFAENWFLPILLSIFAAGVLVSIPIRNKWVAYRSRKNSTTVVLPA